MPIRALSWIGFGGLLGLLTFIGISALSVVAQMQVRNEEIRKDYLQRADLLDQLRSETYLSGTYVRDFLMETDEPSARRYRDEFLTSRKRIQESLTRYAKLLRPEDRAALDSLSKGLHDYFDSLSPALQWDAAQRERFGRAFMRDQVQRRRMNMLNLANKVGEVNQRQMAAGNAEVQRLFRDFRHRLFVLLGVTLLIGISLAAITINRLLTLEQQAALRYRESQDLSAKLVDAQEQERRSIARELHDEVGQSLSALLLAVANLAKALPARDQNVHEHISNIRSLAEKCISIVRNMSLLLRPSMLDDLGLIPALQWQARETSRATGMRVSVAAQGVPDDLPDDYKTAIYRIVQEALHNCQKHSSANVVRIQVEHDMGQLSISVQDDGNGFRPEDRGLGLLGIEERAKRLGGKLVINSEDGNGTLLSVVLPRR